MHSHGINAQVYMVLLIHGGEPSALDVHHAGLLAVMLNLEPLVQASVHTQRAALDVTGTNLQDYSPFTYRVGLGYVFVQACDRNIVTDVLYVDVKDFVPLRGLARIVFGLRPELLLAVHNLAEGIHLAEGLRVAGESRFNKFKS